MCDFCQEFRVIEIRAVLLVVTRQTNFFCDRFKILAGVTIRLVICSRVRLEIKTVNMHFHITHGYMTRHALNIHQVRSVLHGSKPSRLFKQSRMTLLTIGARVLFLLDQSFPGMSVGGCTPLIMLLAVAHHARSLAHLTKISFCFGTVHRERNC